MKLKLRDYQIQGMNDIRAAFAGKQSPNIVYRKGHHGPAKRVLYVLPTGGGKTVVYAAISEGASSKGNRCLILEHRKELIYQASMALARLGVPERVIAPPPKVAEIRRRHIAELGQPYVHQSADVAVASVQTLARRIPWLDEYRAKLVICDEAHHAVAGTWMRILEETPYSSWLGVTATPCRTNGQGLGDVFDAMVMGPTIGELIDDGYLCQPKLFSVPIRDGGDSMSSVGRKGGDLDADQMADILDRPTITGDAVEHYTKHAPGRPAIVFCCNRRHAKHVAQQFRDAGWRFEVIDGTMEDRDRDNMIAGLASGELHGLVSVDLISEGTDIPVAEVAIMLRKTESEGMFLQMVGRVLRPVYAPGFDLDTLQGRLEAMAAGGKHYGLILDHVGNILIHGKPQDDRAWSLEGRKRKKSQKGEPEEDIKIKQCPVCYHVHDPAPQCPECGHVYDVIATPTGPRQRDGELTEVEETETERKRREERRAQGQARTLEALQRQGMSEARAKHILEAREAKQRLQEELKTLLQKWTERTTVDFAVGWGCNFADVDRMKPKELRTRITEVSEALFTAAPPANDNAQQDLLEEAAWR